MISQNRKEKYRSLTVSLASTFFAISIVVLLLVTGLEMYANLQDQRIAIADRQQRIAQQAAHTVKTFIQEIFRGLDTAVNVANLIDSTNERRKLTLNRLLGIEKSVRHLTLFDERTMN